MCCLSWVACSQSRKSQVKSSCFCKTTVRTLSALYSQYTVSIIHNALRGPFTSRDPHCAVKAARLPTSDCLRDIGIAHHQSVRRRSRSRAQWMAQRRSHTQTQSTKEKERKSLDIRGSGGKVLGQCTNESLAPALPPGGAAIGPSDECPLTVRTASLTPYSDQQS